MQRATGATRREERRLEQYEIDRPDVAGPGASRTPPVLTRLRAATGTAHKQLEQELDVVRALADPQRRHDLIARYAAFLIAGESTLVPRLSHLQELDMAGRRRGPLFPPASREQPHQTFPAPQTAAEGLGMLYVLEGSTLGGRLILRLLAERGVDIGELAFLDPYGPDTGKQWQKFLAVLARETAGAECRIAEACRGAVAAFAHARNVLCGEPA